MAFMLGEGAGGYQDGVRGESAIIAGIYLHSYHNITMLAVELTSPLAGQ